MRNKYLSLIFLLILTFTASFIGSYITSIYKEPWYSTLVLPKISPPSWVFAPVWSTLYLLMSVAIWKVWINNFNKKILSLYLVHLFFNATWSIIFFGFHNILLALINLILILILIILLMINYYKVEKISFYLMIPYLFWTLFAFILNYSILMIN